MDYYIKGIKQENNKLKRFGIWIWYNDWFRIIFILLGVWWAIPLIILLEYLGMPEDVSKELVCAVYLIVFCLGVTYNDYSNLRRIGMDEYRNKLE